MPFVLRADTIRDLLDRTHRTHRVFAGELGISPAYLSLLVNGRRTLAPKMRRRLLNHPAVVERALAEHELWTERQ